MAFHRRLQRDLDFQCLVWGHYPIWAGMTLSEPIISRGFFCAICYARLAGGS